MLPTTKLTKRQKKGIAFRERKLGKRKSISPGDLEDEIDVLGLRDQVPADSAQGRQDASVEKGEAGAETKAARRVVVVTQREKRRIDEEEETFVESDEPRPKRRRGSPHLALGEFVDEAGEAEKGRQKTKQRFILFLGNLKYTTTPEAIESHFAVCVPPPSVRLLTPKSSTKLAVKSKGCAFLEFNHRGALQQGLKLHHTQLDGRQINVELTAGGGGNGASRTKKLRERNKELEGRRVCHVNVVGLMQLTRHHSGKDKIPGWVDILMACSDSRPHLVQNKSRATGGLGRSVMLQKKELTEAVGSIKRALENEGLWPGISDQVPMPYQ